MKNGIKYKDMGIDIHHILHYYDKDGHRLPLFYNETVKQYIELQFMERKLEKEVHHDSDKTFNYSYYEAIQC